jgi:zinc protease
MRIVQQAFVLLLLIAQAGCLRAGFVQQNLKTFHEFKLANGIPVIVKLTSQSQIQAVVCTLSGGKALVPPDKAGLDELVGKLMSMESKNYPDLARRALLKKTSASISAGTDLDYAYYSLKTIDAYFDETFDLYADLFLNPVFPEPFFTEVLINMQNKYRSEMTDGYARVSTAVNRSFFTGHPYASYLYNLESLGNISLADVRAFYAENYVACRLRLFAVGDFDLERLREKLNATFGQISAGRPHPAPALPFQADPNPPLLLDPYPDLKPGVAYVRGNFAAPAMGQEGYWPLAMATSMASDIMNDLIRTKQGLVYSVWSHLSDKRINYGVISAYRTSDPARVAELIGQSIEVAAAGKCVSPYAGQAPESPYVPIAQALDFYKRSFATSFYSSLRDNAAVAMQMAESQALTGDHTTYLRVLDRIKEVSAADVQQAITTHIKSRPISWAITANPEMIELLRQAPGAYAATCREVQFP